MKKRNLLLDIVKGLGIILVVLGHSINSSVDIFDVNIEKAIYVFHMPLFFLVSGFLIKYERENNTLEYIKKKMKSIMLPYFIFSLLSFAYWVLVERKIRNQIGISIAKVFLNIFVCKVDSQLLYPNVVLWFLPCLFVSEILYYFFRKAKKDYFIVPITLITFILGLILCSNKIVLPFAIETAFVSVLFICIGDLISRYSIKLNKMLYVLFSLLSITLYSVALIYNSNISMLDHKYGNPVLFVIGAVGGSGIIYMLSILLNKIKTIKTSFAYLGMNSIIIMLCHEPIKRIIAKVLSMIIGISDDSIRNTIIGGLVITIIVIGVMIPTIYIINTYFPFIIGKKRTNKAVIL